MDIQIIFPLRGKRPFGGRCVAIFNVFGENLNYGWRGAARARRGKGNKESSECVKRRFNKLYIYTHFSATSAIVIVWLGGCWW